MPISDDQGMQIKLHPVMERQVITDAGILYDFLADAVDEINSVFSKQVN